MIRTGLDNIARNPRLSSEWGNCGLVSNQASVGTDFAPAWKVLHAILDKRLVSLFGPQHGFESTVQENMLETGHATHVPTGLPVFSLYSETREPRVDMLKNLDTIVIDLPVIGCRIYTYKYTVAACLRAAKKHGKRVVVLDRPNPLGGVILEGRVLEPETRSFVGEFPIPMRHGLSMGEVALLFNKDIGAPLEVVKMDGWKPEEMWLAGGRPWVLTSPNIPTVETTYVFPGMVLLEGVNLSEGRGTCLPFLLIGSPYIKDATAFTHQVASLCGKQFEGVHLRSTQFMPAFHKWKDEVCNGFQIHVTDPAAVRSFALGLAVIRAAIETSPGWFAWRQPPYEYEYIKPPALTLSGSMEFM